MKTKFIILLCLCAGSAVAQAPVSNQFKEKMNALSGWVGRWKGEGSMMTPTGETRKSMVDERIESKLDGAILLVEGIGKYNDANNVEVIVHHAMAVVSYDAVANQYKMKSWLKDGKSTDAWFNVIDKNQYQWGFEGAFGKTRYSIVLDPAKKTWYETGEFSKDGTTWRKFFEMNLTKIED